MKISLKLLLPTLAFCFLILAIVSGTIVSRQISVNTFEHIETIGSGFQRLKHFIASALYLQLDDYHHIAQFQGASWTEVTDYLPQMWLISKLDPNFTDVYTDAGYHLAINLNQIDKGIEFMTEGVEKNPDSLDVRFEYAYLLWQTQTASKFEILQQILIYRSLLRKQNGDPEDPYNEPSSSTIISELFKTDPDSMQPIAQLYTNRSFFIREAIQAGLYYPDYLEPAPNYMKP